MKKSTKMWLKQKLAWLLIVLMSIESIAAVVRDNDGAAFITKAEFESLKNDFQSQINRYNSSLDNKIDGAIATYLAGVSVAKRTRVRVIGYDKNNVHSVINNETFKWKEGSMNLFGQLGIIRFDDGNDISTTVPTRLAQQPYVGFYIFRIGENDLEVLDKFYENAIKKVDFDELTAQWYGYAESRYKMRLYAYNFGNYGIAAPIYDSGELSWQIAYFSANSTRAGQDYLPVSLKSSSYGYSYGRPTIDGSGSIGNDLILRFNEATLLRYEVAATASTIISTKCDNEMKSFTNYDDIYDFMNDDENPSYETHSELFATDSQVFKDINAGFALSPKVPDPAHRIQPWYSGVSDESLLGNEPWGLYRWSAGSWPYKSVNVKVVVARRDDYRDKKPYVGFTKYYISNWNQICLPKYDDYITDMKTCDVNLNVIKNKGVDRLSVTAGLPICKVEKEKKLVLPLSFKDDKDHYVWVKEASFNNHLDPQNDPDCVTTFQKILNDGVQDDTLLNSTLRAIKVPAGKTVTITTNEMVKDAYIFIKWSLTNNSCAGGGEFITPYEVVVEG